MSMKQQAPFLLRPCDGNPNTNGSFLQIDSTDKVPIHTTLENVCLADFWKQDEHKTLHNEFKFDMELCCSLGKFIADYDEIALDSPELEELVIYRCHGKVGESKAAKNTSTSLERQCKHQERPHHAIAWSANRRKLCMFTKQLASMKKVETTRKKVEHGERPLLHPHLVFLVLEVVSTTLAKDKQP
jgi:hypothetical protein